MEKFYVRRVIASTYFKLWYNLNPYTILDTAQITWNLDRFTFKIQLKFQYY